MDCTRGMEWSDSDNSVTESIFVSKKHLISVVDDTTSTLYLFLELLATGNHFRVCLSSETAGKFSAQ